MASIPEAFSKYNQIFQYFKGTPPMNCRGDGLLQVSLTRTCSSNQLQTGTTIRRKT
jgi:hypothetical protein